MYPVWIVRCCGRVVAVQAYYVLFLLAILVTVGLALGIARRRGMPPFRSGLCLLVLALAGVIGARWLHAVLHAALYANDPSRLYTISVRGFSMFGGFFLCLPVGLVVCRVLGVNVLRLGDSTAPALGVGIAIVRVGCFLAGCCYGIRTEMFWGVTFPAGSPAHVQNILDNPILALAGLQAVHPTQLYESAAALAAATIAGWFLVRRSPSGTAFSAFVLCYAAARWILFYLRPQPESGGLLPCFQPVACATAMLVALGFLLLRGRMAGDDVRMQT